MISCKFNLEMQKSTLFNMPAFDFPKIDLKSKELQLTALVVLGILAYRFISSRHIGKDQKTVESRMRRNRRKDPGKKFETTFSFI